jgi:hypothetical protein
MAIAKEWRSLRQKVLKRDSQICQYCGGPASAVDHVIPRSKGGSDDLENLRASCKRCNSFASDNLFADFKSRRDYILSCHAGSPDVSLLVDGETRVPHGPLWELMSEYDLNHSKVHLTKLGRKLGVVIGRRSPFSYKHLNAIAFGHFEPGKDLSRAITILLAQSDGSPGTIEASMQIWSPSQAGAMIQMLPARRCRDCLRKFIPNTRRRVRCYVCSPPAHRRK